MAFIEIASGRLAYDDAGSGPPVILSHASIADRRMWDEVMPALTGRYRVVCYDRLGHGESEDPVVEVDHGGDLLSLIEALDLHRVALIGSSMGGGYSVDAALAAPQRVTALALVCSGLSGWQWPEQMRDETRRLLYAAVPAQRLAEYGSHTAPEVLDADIASMAEMQARYLIVGPARTPAALDTDVWHRVLEMARDVFAREWRGPAYTERVPDPLPQHRLGEISAPTLVMTGLADSPYVNEISDLLANQIPGALRHDLTGLGHLPSMERPGEIAQYLLDFLDDVHRQP